MAQDMGNVKFVTLMLPFTPCAFETGSTCVKNWNSYGRLEVVWEDLELCAREEQGVHQLMLWEDARVVHEEQGVPSITCHGRMNDNIHHPWHQAAVYEPGADPSLNQMAFGFGSRGLFDANDSQKARRLEKLFQKYIPFWWFNLSWEGGHQTTDALLHFLGVMVVTPCKQLSDNRTFHG